MVPAQLLVLAGGFGTRLRSVVAEVPKPLAPVAGRPYLHYLIENWIDQGITDMTFLLHHQADQIEAFLDVQRKLDAFRHCKMRTLIEPQPLGTGGAVAYAVRQARPARSFLVANADTWLGSGITTVGTAAEPALGIVYVADAGRFGTVRVADDKVAAFEEKCAQAGAGWINAGLYHLRPEHFDGWDGEPFSLERDLFPRLAAGRALRAVRLETDFIDIGVPEDYRRFCAWIETEKTNAL